MRRTSPKGEFPVNWEPIAWDEALEEIADRMRTIRDEHGAEQVAFSVTTPSGTHMSDGIAWIERFIRAFGSPNTIYATEICNWHKDQTTKLTYGADIGTPDFANTDCVLLWGHNPTATWLARNVEIQDALRRGAKLVVVDPRQTVLARRADAWLQVKPGTDQTLALGLVRLVLLSEEIDWQHIAANTNASVLVRKDTGALLRESDLVERGLTTRLIARDENRFIRFCEETNQWLDPFDKLQLHSIEPLTSAVHGAIECETVLEQLEQVAAEFDEKAVERETGVSTEALHIAAHALTSSGSVSYYAWNGVGQGAEATQTDRAISILYGLLGHLGKRGGNMPGSPFKTRDIAGHDLLSPEQKAKALGIDIRPLGPPSMGWVTAGDVYDAVIDQVPYPIRMLFSFGGNLLLAQPETGKATRALEQLGYHVHSDFFLNDTANYADIVLPVATSWEREGLRVGFDSSLKGLALAQLRPAVVSPVGESKSDIGIALELSKRLELGDMMFGCGVDEGYEFHLRETNITIRDLRERPEGIEIDGLPYLSGQEFRTLYGLLQIYSHALHSIGQPPIPKGNYAVQSADAFPLMLSCAKDVAYCHSQGRNLQSLRRLRQQPELEMSEVAANKRGIVDGEWVMIRTQAGHFSAVAKITKRVPDECVFAQHGWQQLAATDDFPTPRTNYNAAVDTINTDPVSGSINLKRVPCEIEKLEAPV